MRHLFLGIVLVGLLAYTVQAQADIRPQPSECGGGRINEGDLCTVGAKDGVCERTTYEFHGTKKTGWHCNTDAPIELIEQKRAERFAWWPKLLAASVVVVAILLFGLYRLRKPKEKNAA